MSPPHGSERRSAPTPLLLACVVALLEAAALAGLGVVEIATLSSSRMSMGVTTTVFFAGYAAALAWCAWSLIRLRSWARSPVVLAQLIQLGVAWSFRGGSTTWVAAALAVAAFIVLVGVFSPPSLVAVAESDS